MLAAELPQTIADRARRTRGPGDVLTADALGSVGEASAARATVLAANLPYNVAVPVVLHLLAALPSLERGVVMVQAEVADRMCAGPGSRVYGVPSAKLAWYADARLAGTVPRTVFWPVPNVDSKLVAFTRPRPAADDGQPRGGLRGDRRRLRPAPQDPARGSGGLGRAPPAEDALRAAGVDPGRGGRRSPIAMSPSRHS